jgi:BTG family
MYDEIPFAVEVVFQVLSNKRTNYWENDRRYCECLPYKKPYKRESCNSRCRPSQCSVCCQRIKDEYCKTLYNRFKSISWMPERPWAGHGWRKIQFTTKKMDHYLAISLERLGYDLDNDYKLYELFTELPLTMFVDPGRVTFYLRDGASVRVLDVGKDDPKKVDILNMYTIHPPHCGRAANRSPNTSQCEVCDANPFSTPISRSAQGMLEMMSFVQKQGIKREPERDEIDSFNQDTQHGTSN